MMMAFQLPTTILVMGVDEGSLIPSSGLKDKSSKDLYIDDKVIPYTDCSRTEVERTEITESIVDWMGMYSTYVL